MYRRKETPVYCDGSWGLFVGRVRLVSLIAQGYGNAARAT